jgi:arylsulfatase A-like enzyme
MTTMMTAPTMNVLKRNSLTAILIAGLLCIGAGSVPPESPAPPVEEKRPNLLLITLDTTRADFLGSYGHPLPTSPNLDRLAARGVRFAETLAQVPLTGPSHATIMTGLYPHEHGAVRNGVPLPESVQTLAERLKEVGYRNAAFLAGWTLRANLSGLAQGFDLYDDRMQDRYRLVNTQRFAEQVTPPAMEWLEENSDESFFLWVHYFDPHYPYVGHEENLDELERRAASGTDPIPERHVRYASEVRHMDRWIGELLDTLRRLDLESSTLVVVAGDHGESLGEHDYVGHGRFLHEEVLRVPLIFARPGVLPEGTVVRTPVALLDLTPTLLSLLDLPRMTQSSGIDLRPLLAGVDEELYADRQIRFAAYPGARKPFWRIFSPKVSSMPTLVGYRQGDLKVIHDPKSDHTTVFDLAAEGGEHEDLFDHYPGLRASGDRLERWIESTATNIAEPQLDDEDAKRLRSLGYNQ